VSVDRKPGIEPLEAFPHRAERCPDLFRAAASAFSGSGNIEGVEPREGP